MVFLVKKGSYNDIIRHFTQERYGKSEKDRENLRNFRRENGNFFLQNRHSEILVYASAEKFFRSPPNSAPGLRLWVGPIYSGASIPWGERSRNLHDSHFRGKAF